MYREGAFKVYRKMFNHFLWMKKVRSIQGFSCSKISYDDWECFVSVLLLDKASEGHGADLRKHEVKSAAKGNAYEYQYHRNSWLAKLEEDQLVDHIFVSYENNYEDVDVRRICSQKMTSVFELWKPKILESYDCENPKQRCRHSVSFGFVESHGEILFQTRNGELITLDQFEDIS